MPVARVIAVGFVVLFVSGGARFAVGLIFKPMVDELGWARGELGLAVGLYLVVSAFATFIAGRLADRMDARALLGAGMLLGGIGIGLMSLVSAPWQAMLLYGVIFALGNGAASLTTVGVVVTRSAPRRAGLANAAVISGTSVGQLVMIAALAAVLVETAGARCSPGSPQRTSCCCRCSAQAAGRKAAGCVEPAARRPRSGRRRAYAALLAAGSHVRHLRLGRFLRRHACRGFRPDRGLGALLAGNLLALMGLTALIGVLAAGALSDRAGPVTATAIAFGARIAVFGLIALDQSPLSIAIFALVFGATFLVTAPLTVLFVRESFGTRHLGALTGIITMVHQIFGGIGAYAGALVFDYSGSYDAAFIALLVASAIGFVLALMLRAPKALATSSASARSSL